MQATTQTEVQQAATAALAADTLRGDVRDVLLNIVRGMEAPWSKLSERDQEWRINAIDKAAEKVVRGSVRIVANQGFPHVEVLVSNKGKFGGGQLEMTLTANFTVENATKLSEYGVGSAILVLAEPGEFFGERRIARAQPDQPGLPIDGDDEGEGDGEPLAEADREFTREATPQTTRSRRRSTIRENEPA